MEMRRGLLALDIDGVLAFEAEPPLVDALEVLRLHAELGAMIAALDAPFLVLTHRSRREARHILAQLGIAGVERIDLIAAEDLFLSALSPRGLARLWRGGLMKSLIIDSIVRRYGVQSDEIAFVDDKRSNLRDMLGSGLGLAMLAPSATDARTGQLTTFSFAEMLAVFDRWRATGTPVGLVELAAVHLPIGAWQRTGADTAAHGRHIFNRFRAIGRNGRSYLSRRAAQ